MTRSRWFLAGLAVVLLLGVKLTVDNKLAKLIFTGTGASSPSAPGELLCDDDVGDGHCETFEGGGVTVLATTALVATAQATADAALPKAGGAMTGAITTNSTFDGVDVGVAVPAAQADATTALAGLTPTAILDGDFACVSGHLQKTGAGTYTCTLDNLAAAVPPVGATDDVTLGYGVGSLWYDTTADLPYVCLDATDGAAVWLLGTGISDHGALTGLADDDHPQYVLAAGDTMTGTLTIPDGTSVQLGTQGDCLMSYDDAADNALELTCSAQGDGTGSVTIALGATGDMATRLGSQAATETWCVGDSTTLATCVGTGSGFLRVRADGYVQVIRPGGTVTAEYQSGGAVLFGTTGLFPATDNTSTIGNAANTWGSLRVTTAVVDGGLTTTGSTTSPDAATTCWGTGAPTIDGCISYSAADGWLFSQATAGGDIAMRLGDTASGSKWCVGGSMMSTTCGSNYGLLVDGTGAVTVQGSSNFQNSAMMASNTDICFGDCNTATVRWGSGGSDFLFDLHGITGAEEIHRLSSAGTSRFIVEDSGGTDRFVVTGGTGTTQVGATAYGRTFSTSTAYTVLATDRYVTMNPASNGTVSMYEATGTGNVVHVQTVHATSTVTVQALTDDTFECVAGTLSLLTQYEYVELQDRATGKWSCKAND